MSPGLFFDMVQCYKNSQAEPGDAAAWDDTE